MKIKICKIYTAFQFFFANVWCNIAEFYLVLKLKSMVQLMDTMAPRLRFISFPVSLAPMYDQIS